MLWWVSKKVSIKTLKLIVIGLVEIGQLNDAEMMEAGIKEATVSSEPPSNIIANLDNKVNSPDDYIEYTNAKGRKSRRFKDSPSDFLTEAEENV